MGQYSSRLPAFKRRRTHRHHTVGDGAVVFKCVPPGGAYFKTAFFPKMFETPPAAPRKLNQNKNRNPITNTCFFVQKCFSYLRQAADSCFFRTGHACSKLTSGCIRMRIIKNNKKARTPTGSADCKTSGSTLTDSIQGSTAKAPQVQSDIEAGEAPCETARRGLEPSPV